MSVLNQNALLPLDSRTLEDVARAFGVMQFTGESLENWTQTIGGIILQGGKTADTTINMIVPLPTQVLGIFCTQIGAAGSVAVDNVTLDSFDVIKSAPSADIFWFALGV